MKKSYLKKKKHEFDQIENLKTRFIFLVVLPALCRKQKYRIWKLDNIVENEFLIKEEEFRKRRLHSKGFDTFISGQYFLLSDGAGLLCRPALWLDVGFRFARVRLDLAGGCRQGAPLQFERLFGLGGGVAAGATLLQSSSGLHLLDPLHGSLEQLPTSLLVSAGTRVQLQEPNWTQEVKGSACGI